MSNNRNFRKRGNRHRKTANKTLGDDQGNMPHELDCLVNKLRREIVTLHEKIQYLDFYAQRMKSHYQGIIDDMHKQNYLPTLTGSLIVYNTNNLKTCDGVPENVGIKKVYSD